MRAKAWRNTRPVSAAADIRLALSENDDLLAARVSSQIWMRPQDPRSGQVGPRYSRRLTAAHESARVAQSAQCPPRLNPVSPIRFKNREYQRIRAKAPKNAGGGGAIFAGVRDVRGDWDRRGPQRRAKRTAEGPQAGRIRVERSCQRGCWCQRKRLSSPPPRARSRTPTAERPFPARTHRLQRPRQHLNHLPHPRPCVPVLGSPAGGT
jgi:hypothetical protein